MPTGTHAANYTAASDGAVNHWDVLSELSLKDREEVLLPSDADQAVFVCQFGPHSNLNIVLESTT